LWVVILGAIGAVWWQGGRYLYDSEVAILPTDSSAPWIVYPNSPRTNIHLAADLDTRFRRSVTLAAMPDQASLHWRGFRRLVIEINGQAIPKSTGNWKIVQSVDVLPFLHVGENVIEITVTNHRAPAVLSAKLVLPDRVVSTDSSWQASIAGSSWRAARRAAAAMDTDQLTPDFPPVAPWQAILNHRTALLIYAALSLLVMMLHMRIGIQIDQRFVTWSLLIAAGLWAALFINNAPMLGVIGHDARFHMDYIQYILDHGRLPSVDQGAQMFQPPLYYMISAGLLQACGLSTVNETAIYVLRMQAVVFGIAHLLLIGVGLRLLMPRQFGKQLIGIVVAAFMPLHLYSFQYPTNELLAATLTTGALVLALRFVQHDAPSMKLGIALGACIAAALLTKTTPIIACVLILTAVVGRSITLKHQWRASSGSACAAMGVCLLGCGWYYLYIYRQYGKLLMTGWGPVGEPTWWSDPGVCTIDFFTRVGRSLIMPIFSGFYSFADGYYSTLFGDGLIGGRVALLGSVAWDMTLISAGYVLALPVAGAMIVGGGIYTWRWLRRPDASSFIMLSLPLAMIAAMVYLSTRTPNYGHSRAAYAMGAMLPICALAAQGLYGLMHRHAVARWILITLLSVWVVNSYASYWIVRGSPDALAYRAWYSVSKPQHLQRTRRDLHNVLTRDPKHLLARITLVRMASLQGHHDITTNVLRNLQQDYPQAASIRLWLAHEAQAMQQFDLAEQHYKIAIELNPDDGHAHDAYASLLIQQKRVDRAIDHLRKALHSLNDNPQVHAQLADAYVISGQNDPAAYHRDIARLLKKAHQRAVADMEGQSP
jgi:hypothetical protein